MQGLASNISSRAALGALTAIAHAQVFEAELRVPEIARSLSKQKRACAQHTYTKGAKKHAVR